MFQDFIASQFKKPAGLFGIFSANLMVKKNQKNYDKLIEELDLQPNDTVLEIGYGPGIGIQMIAEQCASCSIDGIDFSKLMYKRAARYNKHFIKAGRVRLQHGDFLNVSVAHKSYDKIFCLNVVYFWNDLRVPFEKIFSLLKKGGSFHIYMADKSALVAMKFPDSVFNKYSIEQVEKALKAAGFAAVERTREKGHYIKVKT